MRHSDEVGDTGSNPVQGVKGLKNGVGAILKANFFLAIQKNKLYTLIVGVALLVFTLVVRKNCCGAEGRGTRGPFYWFDALRLLTTS